MYRNNKNNLICRAYTSENLKQILKLYWKHVNKNLKRESNVLEILMLLTTEIVEIFIIDTIIHETMIIDSLKLDIELVFSYTKCY